MSTILANAYRQPHAITEPTELNTEGLKGLEGKSQAYKNPARDWKFKFFQDAAWKTLRNSHFDENQSYRSVQAAWDVVNRLPVECRALLNFYVVPSRDPYYATSIVARNGFSYNSFANMTGETSHKDLYSTGTPVETRKALAQQVAEVKKEYESALKMGPLRAGLNGSF
jgi:hypothetical protein